MSRGREIIFFGGGDSAIAVRYRRNFGVSSLRITLLIILV